MKKITMDFSKMNNFVTADEIKDKLELNRSLITEILNPVKRESDVLGWIDLEKVADEKLVGQIEEKACEIREKADVFVLIGIGGSNQGARAVIEVLGDSAVKVIYAGNTISPDSLNKVLAELENKSVYVNVIAKNFATLEPGITFRVIRHYMEKTYGIEEAAKRIIATGSLNNSSLERLGKQKGYTLLPFPLDVGGRFSVLSAVGLLAMAVAGVDIRDLLLGAKEIKKYIQEEVLEKNDAVKYALYRNILLEKGFSIEIMAYFEPLLTYFSKWWIQLFGESEGKEGKGIFPTACSFSEDLHSLGQYIQEGQRILFETFLNVQNQGSSAIIPNENEDIDGFSYINGRDFSYINDVAFKATLEAHTAGGVPCAVLNIPKLTAHYIGQMFYFFEYACYISGSILGVNPFDQPGVEAYKTHMFTTLGKIEK